MVLDLFEGAKASDPAECEKMCSELKLLGKAEKELVRNMSEQKKH